MLDKEKASEPDVKANRVHVIQKALIKWGKQNYKDFPWRSTKNTFHALVAEIMLQRTRAEQVVPVYSTFARDYLIPAEVIAEDRLQILRLLKPLGLEWRAKKILELAHELACKEEIPRTYSRLVELPGVGSYVASAFLSFHIGERAPIMDSNAVRLWSRVFGLDFAGEPRRKRSFLMIAEKMTPKRNFKAFNYAILDLTRIVCKPKPLCISCPINHFCEHYRQS